jgi:small subunit ribosomal protein S7
MSRRARAIKREIAPDAKYHSVTIARLINKIMMNGKKETAERILYDAMQIMEQNEGNSPVVALEQALKN